MYGMLLKFDHNNNCWTLAAGSPTNYGYNNPVHLAEFNGDIYGAATSGYWGQGLYRWNGSDAWVHICDFPTTSAGPQDLIVFNGQLYATYNGDLYVWDGATTLTKVLNTLYPYPNQMYVDCMTVFNGKLYAGASIGAGSVSSALLEWDGVGASWSIVATANDWHIQKLLEFNGKLYGGSYYSTGHLYEWNGTDAWITRATLGVGSYVGLVNLFILNGCLCGGASNGDLLKWDGVDAMSKIGHFERMLYCVAQFTN